VFAGVEINSSFYRPHRPATYRRWAEAVPAGFRFSVKMPRTVTHLRRLVDCGELVDDFLVESGALGEKRDVVLVQLPPSLGYDEAIAAAFFDDVRARYNGALVCEPRHASWFAAEPNAMLAAHRVARVAADPAVVPAAADPGGWPDLVYVRLHGSPHIYASSYDDGRLGGIAAMLRAARGDAWCIFDNTRSGAATADALALLAAQP
jgi:uncharacterized protein YecE (DUF72 family)